MFPNEELLLLCAVNQTPPKLPIHPSSALQFILFFDLCQVLLHPGIFFLCCWLIFCFAGFVSAFCCKAPSSPATCWRSFLLQVIAHVILFLWSLTRPSDAQNKGERWFMQVVDGTIKNAGSNSARVSACKVRVHAMGAVSALLSRLRRSLLFLSGSRCTTRAVAAA